MSAPSSTNNSQGVLIALVVVSLFASLGTLGLLARSQNQAADVQRELLTTLTTLRPTPGNSTGMTNGQPSPAGNPVNNTMAPTDSVPSAMAPTQQNNDWGVIMHDGVSISYPKNLSVTTYDDEFTSGQRDLRISSSANRKVGIDSSNFQGYELVMKRIDNQQYAENRKESTVNPRVSYVVDMCDGTTCPDAQYVFTKNGKRYLIEVLYHMSPYQAGIDLNNRIIASIK